MKKIVLILLITITYYPINAQSIEASLYLKEELIKQRDELLHKAQELQVRIDAIDQKLSNQSDSNTQYVTKSVKYNSGTNFSNSIPKNSSLNRKYPKSTSRKYIRGSRGGCYYINSNGNKTYVDRSMCN